ncbi:hypothetical protein PDE_03822 [Penicillium oxalicum 114-2]|uniref:Uncharacterized protein n=1 Tax=Penicillium oxalicum (strain 114-2 / CGMCC 5302) TaxID=933388 RepID=S7ZJP5_PENO1|nr:hypothetical protein PDE_03822 [Penicillium oxalicum 114-2]
MPERFPYIKRTVIPVVTQPLYSHYITATATKLLFACSNMFIYIRLCPTYLPCMMLVQYLPPPLHMWASPAFIFPAADNRISIYSTVICGVQIPGEHGPNEGQRTEVLRSMVSGVMGLLNGKYRFIDVPHGTKLVTDHPRKGPVSSQSTAKYCLNEDVGHGALGIPVANLSYKTENFGPEKVSTMALSIQQTTLGSIIHDGTPIFDRYSEGNPTRYDKNGLHGFLIIHNACRTQEWPRNSYP